MMLDLTPDNIEVGREIGPWRYPLQERIASYLEATENRHFWYHERSPWGPPVAPPSIIGSAALRFLSQHFRLPAGASCVQQQFYFDSPLRRDRQLIAYSQFLDSTPGSGWREFRFQARFRDESGLIIGRSVITVALLERGEKEAAKGRQDPSLAEAPKGNELSSLARTVTKEKLAAYDEDWPNASPHGLLTVDYISQLMFEAFGRYWLEGGQMSLSFLRPISAGDTLTAKGGLKERRPEGAFTRHVYTVWCENRANEVVTTGMASGLVPNV